jgi:putative tricarboxylic transport membrane protein
MVMANFLFLIIGYFAIPLFAKVVTIRKSLLLPLTVVFAFAGSYVPRSDPLDLLVLVAFGAFGYLARKLSFGVTPMVMAFILGKELEYSFGQTLILSQGNLLQYILLERPITAVIILATPVLTYLMWRRSARLRQELTERVSE